MFQLHSAEYFYDGEVHIVLLSGNIYAKKPMEKILNKEIVATLEEFANSFNKLHLNDLEVSILCAVRLTCSGEYMNSKEYRFPNTAPVERPLLKREVVGSNLGRTIPKV